MVRPRHSINEFTNTIKNYRSRDETVVSIIIVTVKQKRLDGKCKHLDNEPYTLFIERATAIKSKTNLILHTLVLDLLLLQSATSLNSVSNLI